MVDTYITVKPVAISPPSKRVCLILDENKSPVSQHTWDDETYNEKVKQSNLTEITWADYITSCKMLSFKFTSVELE